MGKKTHIGDAPAYPMTNGTPGMSLRQAYQMAAVQGLSAGDPLMKVTDLVQKAEQIADAMMEKENERYESGPPLDNWL